MQELTVAQQEYFMDTSLKNSKGELVVCYHSTNAGFDTFDKNHINTEDGYCGRGFYFTSINNWASTYGINKLECYLNIENPLIVEDLDQWDKMDLLDYFSQCEDYKDGYLPRIEGHPQKEEIWQAEYFIDMLENYPFGNTETIDLITDLTNSYNYETFKETKDITDILEDMEDLLQNDEFFEVLQNHNLDDYVKDPECLHLDDLTSDNFHRGYWNEFNGLLTEWAKNHGYDGIFSEKSDNLKIREIVVFEPNQIKSINNLYPTKSNNFKDNSKEYFNTHQKGIDELLADAESKMDHGTRNTDTREYER